MWAFMHLYTKVAQQFKRPTTRLSTTIKQFISKF